MQFGTIQETEVFTNFEPVFDTGDLVRICPLSLCGMDSGCGSSNQGADFLYERPGIKTQALCLRG